MRVFQVSPDGLAAMFEQHHAQEAAEHNECPCGGNCHADDEENVTLAELLTAALVGGGVEEVEADDDQDDDEFDFDVEFEPDYILSDEPQFGPALLSRGQQLDMLGQMIFGLIALTGLYASMIEAD